MTEHEYKAENMALGAMRMGYVCVACKRFFGHGDNAENERMAQYCCAKTFPCECGGRREKGWTICESCRQKKQREAWYAKPEIEWDGKFPIASWSGDEFFFDEDSLFYAFEESTEANVRDFLESLWLTPCDKDNGRHFEMVDYLSDSLPTEIDVHLDCKEIDKAVNDWIESNAPFSYEASGKRLSVDSLLSHFGGWEVSSA